MENTELMQVVKLLDKIIASNNTEMKGAFRELLIVAALTETTNDDIRGPLANLIFSELELLRHELRTIRQELSYARNGKSYYDDYRHTGGRGYASTIDDKASGINHIDWAGIIGKAK